MPITKKLLLISMILAVSSTAMAKIYKWTDKNGATHYTATPPPAKAKAEVKEFKVKKKPASSLTHFANTAAVKKTTSKRNSNRTNQKLALSTKRNISNHCSKIVSSLTSMSGAEKAHEISKCNKNLNKASPEDRQRAFSASESFQELMALSPAVNNEIQKQIRQDMHTQRNKR